MNTQSDLIRASPSQIADVASARLRASPYVPVRRLTCTFDDGLLVLRGSVPSFFHKQLAQQAVFGIKGVKQVLNEIEVPDKSDLRTPDDTSVSRHKLRR
jgi:osmotically-inducible protein OsmY